MTSERKSILRFMGTVLLYALPPLLLLMAVYAIFDPFGALRRYSDFGDGKWEYNRGMISVRTYERAMRRGDRPNSFILGSSLAIFYPAEAWAEKLPPGARVFHIDTSSQPLGILRRSLEYIERSGADIDNVLIILDTEGLSWEEYDGVPFITPAEFYPERPLAPLEFQYRFFGSFLDRRFISGYIPYLITGHRPAWGTKLPHTAREFPVDTLTNEEISTRLDSIIDRDGMKFFATINLPSDFSDVPHTLDYRQLTPKRIADLIAIRDILQRHHTDYRVIIGPNRSTKMLHPADEAEMRRIFGRRYFNFVVPMRHIGSQPTSYYDSFHYRPFVARQILDSVYRALPPTRD